MHKPIISKIRFKITYYDINMQFIQDINFKIICYWVDLESDAATVCWVGVSTISPKKFATKKFCASTFWE